MSNADYAARLRRAASSAHGYATLLSKEDRDALRAGAMALESLTDPPKPLTNFEKWKAELTVERLADTFCKVGVECCKVCPAKGACIGLSTDAACSMMIKTWANSPPESATTNPPQDLSKSEYRRISIMREAREANRAEPN